MQRNNLKFIKVSIAKIIFICRPVNVYLIGETVKEKLPNLFNTNYGYV